MRKLSLLIPLLAASACAPVEPTGGAPMPLINALGAPIGTVRAWQTAGGVTLRIDAGGLPHGIHGIHVHSVGSCVPPDFASAGPHWNPAGRQHGLNNPLGHHAGDLTNVEVAANGVLGEAVTIPGASMASLIDGDGASLVIHAAADDYMTDPSGNSGARIACAVLTPQVEVR
jgi:Cu-Zn family superoxide dismutase